MTPDPPPARLSRSHTTLPPIHHLHPGLPHASMQPPPQPPQPGPSSYIQGATYPIPSTSSLGVRHAEDSDQDAPQGRQKQKRRRQALSCTECKRRKIKCDREHPCGPCARRNDHEKCMWHVIEPMEKYVPRGEFEELRALVQDLKARVQELEAMLRLPSAPSPSAPISRRPSMSAMMPMTSGPPPEPIQGTAITPYQAYGTSTAASSYPLPQQSPRSPVRGDPPRAPVPGTTRSPTLAYRPPTNTSGGSGVPARTGPTSVPESPREPPNLASLRGGAPRRSSISLADLTTPYNTEPHMSKNHSAQTPSGPRLRTPPPGPPSPHLRMRIVDTRQQVPV